MELGRPVVFSRMARLELAVSPMLNTVTRDPDAMPRGLGGIDPTMEEMLEDTNIPLPRLSNARAIENLRITGG